MTKITKIKTAVYFCSFLLIFLFFAIFLALVFSGGLILPQTFHIGFLAIHYYGVIMALAAAAGFLLALKRSPKFGIAQKRAEDILFWLIIGGFIGARLYHVASSAPYYARHPADILKVWNGGLSIYGALIGGIITLAIFNLSQKENKTVSRVTLDTVDWLTPSLILGQIIGRFGNFFNYEAFGYPTNLPWKMFVPYNFRPAQFAGYDFFHPWFLYEALGNTIILFFLLKILKPKRPGTLFFSYLLLYNALRFGLEFLRIDSTFIDGIRLNAVASLILAVIGGLGLLFIDRY